MTIRLFITAFASLVVAFGQGCVQFNNADSNGLSGDSDTEVSGGGGGGGGGSGGIDLLVPIEMIDAGAGSDTISSTEFNRSQTPLDTADYDGTVTYYFEIVASKSSVGAGAVDIIDESSTVQGTLSVSGATPTLYRVAWTPSTGAHVYRIRLAQTAGGLRELSVYSARILVRQVAATRTHLYFPLVAQPDGSVQHQDTSGQATTTADDFYTDPLAISGDERHALWLKDSTAFDALSGASPWTFMALMNTGVTAERAWATLYNVDQAQVVTASEVSTIQNQTAGHELVTASLADASAFFDDGDHYEARIRTENPGGFVRLAKAGIWLKLDNLTKGEVYFRVQMSDDYLNTVSTYDYDMTRVRLDASWFTNPAAYFEKSGRAVGGGGTSDVEIIDEGSNASGTSGTPIAGSSLTFNSVDSRKVARTTTFSLTAGDRHYRPRLTLGSGGFHGALGFLVVGFQQ